MVQGSPPDGPVRGLAPCFIPPRMLQSGASFCRTLSAAVCTVAVLVPASLSPLLAPPYDSACPVPDAPVHATGASAVPFPPVPFLTSPCAAKLYTRPALISARFSFVCVPSGVPSARLPPCSPFPSLPLTACNGSSDSTQIIHQCDQNFNDSQMYIGAVNFPLVFMFSVRRQMSPVSARRVAFVFRDFPIGFI